MLAAACALLNVDGQFVFDDQNALVDNPLVRGDVAPHEAFLRDFWGRPAAEGVSTYRPLAPLFFRIEHALGGGGPLAFRLGAVFVHALATMLLVLAARRFGASPFVAGIAGVIFAVHGGHAEAVGANVGQADMLATALGLGALAIVGRPRGLAVRQAALAAAVVLVACLVKEAAVVFGVAVVLAIALDDAPRRDRFARVLPTLAVLAVVVAVQLSLARSTVEWSNNIAYDMGLAERQVLALAVIGRAAAMCFVPTGLAPTHGYAAVDGSLDTLLPLAGPGLVVVATLAIALGFAIRRRARGLALALVVLLGPLVLVSNALVVVPALLPERVLYPAVAAASVLLALGIARVAGTGRAGVVVTTAVAAFLALQTVHYQRPWHDRAALFGHAVAVEPLAITARYNFANASLDAGRLDPAIYHRAIASSLVERYPARVDPRPIAALDALPAAEAWPLVPARLFPDDPCRGVHGLLGVFGRTLPSALPTAVAGFEARYPECFAPR